MACTVILVESGSCCMSEHKELKMNWHLTFVRVHVRAYNLHTERPWPIQDLTSAPSCWEAIVLTTTQNLKISFPAGTRSYFFPSAPCDVSLVWNGSRAQQWINHTNICNNRTKDCRQSIGFAIVSLLFTSVVDYATPHVDDASLSSL